MNNEIKEILDNVRKCCDITKDQNFVVYQRQDILKLLDYITNLQQENEKLKVKYNEEKNHQINYNYFETLYSKSAKEIVIDDLVWKCEELDNFKKEYEKSYIEKEDYKSRIEKVQKIINIEKEKMGYAIYDSCLLLIEEAINGRSDE